MNPAWYVRYPTTKALVRFFGRRTAVTTRTGLFHFCFFLITLHSDILKSCTYCSLKLLIRVPDLFGGEYVIYTYKTSNFCVYESLIIMGNKKRVRTHIAIIRWCPNRQPSRACRSTWHMVLKTRNMLSDGRECFILVDFNL